MKVCNRSFYVLGERLIIKNQINFRNSKVLAKGSH